MDRTAKQGSLKNEPDRAGRDAEDAEKTDPRTVAGQDFQSILDNDWIQQILPQAPTLPGWHCCWLSTTNQYDTIQWRTRMGYVPVKLEEAPHMKNFQLHSGEYDGFISCNEMLLFKVKEQQYQAIMHHFHHKLPQEEAGRLRANVEKLTDEARDSEGTPLISEEGDGMADAVRPVGPPRRFE